MKGFFSGTSVSRILYPRSRLNGTGAVIIYLVPASPPGSSDLPDSVMTGGTYYLLDLAPREVCPAPDVTTRAVGSYPTFSPLPRLVGAVCFLWHWLFPYFSTRDLPVRKHGACWCSDFPPRYNRSDYPMFRKIKTLNRFSYFVNCFLASSKKLLSTTIRPLFSSIMILFLRRTSI